MKTYRQRLTFEGWMGAALAIGCQMGFFIFIAIWARAKYSSDLPPTAVGMLLWLGFNVGLIMLFVGREYYEPEEEMPSYLRSSIAQPRDPPLSRR